jgi:demethylmenaquinone methyltransferase / 2-methoxy-6-polyprenyl-1,4-benzoquinol methylase
MANPFFDAGAERASKVNDLFNQIAPRYDLINDLQSFGLHRRWKHRVIELANPRPAMRALDVCCGTGDLAWALARHGAEVVGLDFSEPMLRIAAAKSATCKNTRTSNVHTSPQFIRADAQHIPFPDNSFSIVTIGYGLRNLVSWEAGLLEMFRVLNPGGRLVALEFGKPDNSVWRALYFGYLRLFVPLLGQVFCRNASAYAYILESLKHYPAQHGIAAKMRQLGFEEVRVLNLLGGVMSINYGQKPLIINHQGKSLSGRTLSPE